VSIKKYDLIYEVSGLVPKPVTVALKDELTISEDIDSEVDEAAARFGYYAVLAEKAESRCERLKLNFNLWEADIKVRRNEECEIAKEKKLTEGQMKAYVMSQDKYKTYQLKLIVLKEQRDVMKVIARAFEKKADLIQTKASNRRSEAQRSR